MRLTVFCGSSLGQSPRYAEAAREFGRAMLKRGVGLVYGGASVGLMGVIADTVLEGGGEVVGVIPRVLIAREIAHRDLTELRTVDTMHERKALMGELGDGFVALPGGAGTLDELFEAWTWAQLGLHDKPCGLLDVDGYYGPLLAAIEHSAREGFIKPQHVHMLAVASEPDRLLDLLLAARERVG